MIAGCGSVGGGDAGVGPQGPPGPPGPPGEAGANPTWNNLPGGSPAMAGDSCAALLTAGMTLSGSYYVNNPHPADAGLTGMPVLVYCDQLTNGGGWALVHNSVLAPSTLAFWTILYADRLGRRGQPSISEDFYDGSLYQTAAASYMDVIEDLQGDIVQAFEATSDGISSTTMKFTNPVKVSGNMAAFTDQFASGWSAPDYDGDTYTPGNCSTVYNNVTQHYSGCWTMNLGSDADSSGGDSTDQTFGPHVHSAAIATPLGLVNDGSNYTRVRRLSRFVKW
jgi:hypothetical protein